MAIRKDANGRPQISQVTPVAAIPGGEFYIVGSGFVRAQRPRVTFGETTGSVIIGSDSFLIARVPEGASGGKLIVENGTEASSAWGCGIGRQVAEGLHPVANPVVDRQGNIYSTLSGPRGQKTPVSVYRVEPREGMKPFLSDLMNATSLAIDRDDLLYVSSRHDGTVYQVTPRGDMSVYVEGMGVATGLAFDEDENLYVGDRSGTVFKISRSRQIYVFATLEPSISAYHLAFGPEGYLYVTGPTTSSFDSVNRISPAGDVSVFYRGLGRPQGIAFDSTGRAYVAGSMGGRRGIVRIDQNAKAELFLSGPNIVGLAFASGNGLIVATNSALYRVDAGVAGRPLP
jgi:sugar lactone lactonase YvrE